MQPKIYSIDQHQIPHDQIDEHALYVIEKLRSAGFAAYLVGGGVRDLLLKRRPKDFDVSTSAKPEEIRDLFRNAILIGRRFRLAHIRFGKKVIEVSTFRAGETEEAGLIVRDNVWGSEEEDVLRRDFTINGLFYDPEQKTVIDYVEGYADVEKRLLRTIGQPAVRFSQDPVRMIRLLKFCARFNLHIEPDTLRALLDCKNEILKSSSVRILEELLRMLESGASKPFFHLLHEYGMLQALLPKVAKYFEEFAEHNELLALLCEADAETRKKTLLRPVLVGALVFPLFRVQLIQRAERGGPMHLGIVHEVANKAVDDAFAPFFVLPRRLHAETAFVLASQFRLQPLDDRPLKHPKPPRDPVFSLALQLFKLRSAIQPELLELYTLWTEACFGLFPENPEPEPRRRRRRRRRRPDGP